MQNEKDILEDKLSFQNSLNQILQTKLADARQEHLRLTGELLQASQTVTLLPQASDGHFGQQAHVELSKLRAEAEAKDKRISELDQLLSEASRREDTLKRQNAQAQEALDQHKRHQHSADTPQNRLMTSSMVDDGPKHHRDPPAKLAELERANRTLEADKNLLILELDTRQAQVNEARDQLQRSKELVGSLQREKSSLKENLRDNEKTLIELRLLVDSLQTSLKETEARTFDLSRKQSTNFESGNGADGSAKEVSKSGGNLSLKENASGDRLIGGQALSKDSRDSFERAPRDLDEIRKENEELKKSMALLQEACSDQQARIQVLKQSCIDFEKKLIIAKVAKDELENESQISNAQKKMLSYLENLLCGIFNIIDSQLDLTLIRQQVESQKRLFEEEKSRLEAVQRRKSNSSDSIFKLDAEGNSLGLGV